MSGSSKRSRGKPWKKGDPSPNPKGRPPRAAELSYLAAIKIGCPEEELVAITKKAVAEAKRGGNVGAKAREWLTKQLGTEAAQKIEQEIRQTTSHVFTDDVSKILADPEATTRLLDAVQGLTVEVTPPIEALSTKVNGNGHGSDPSGASLA